MEMWPEYFLNAMWSQRLDGTAEIDAAWRVGLFGILQWPVTR